METERPKLERASRQIGAALESVLREDREWLNHLFRARIPATRGPDGELLLWFLAEYLDPVITELARHGSDTVRLAVHELYELALELVVARAFGTGDPQQGVLRVWRDVLPRVPALLGKEPGVIAGLLSNAAWQFARQPSASLDDWIARLVDVAAHCSTSDQLLTAGQVAAWRAGMVQYRHAAVDLLDAMDSAIAGALLGMGSGMDDVRKRQMTSWLRRSPWARVEDCPDGAERSHAAEPTPTVMRLIGGFCGFGGAFAEPPRVWVEQDVLLATDGRSVWRVWADCYGTLFDPAPEYAAEVRDEKPKRIWDKFRQQDPHVSASGKVRWSGRIASLPELQDATSVAATRHTLAVTLEDSYRIALLALRPEPWA